jgi:hypothetical protein
MPCEAALLREFVVAGGGLLAFDNSAADYLAAHFGALPGTNGQGCGSTVGSSIVLAAPFGTVNGCITPNFHKTLQTVGKFGISFLSDGSPVGATFAIGTGHAVLICDEEWAQGESVQGCAIGSVDANKLRLFMNSLAHVVPAPSFSFGGSTVAFGDVNCDGAVDVDDLIEVILAWGACPSPPIICPADVDGSGVVDVDDLIAVVLNWG